MGLYKKSRDGVTESANFWVKQINELLKEKNLTQAELAKLSGVSAGSISNWFKGTEPKIESLKSVAKALDVSVDYLVGFSTSRETGEENKIGSKYFGLDDKPMELLKTIKRKKSTLVWEDEFIPIGNKTLSSKLINFIFSNNGFWRDFDELLTNYVQARNEAMYENSFVERDFRVGNERRDIRVAKFELVEQFGELIDDIYESMYKSNVKSKPLFNTHKKRAGVRHEPQK